MPGANVNRRHPDYFNFVPDPNPPYLTRAKNARRTALPTGSRLRSADLDIPAARISTARSPIERQR